MRSLLDEKLHVCTLLWTRTQQPRLHKASKAGTLYALKSKHTGYQSTEACSPHHIQAHYIQYVTGAHVSGLLLPMSVAGRCRWLQVVHTVPAVLQEE